MRGHRCADPLGASEAADGTSAQSSSRTLEAAAGGRRKVQVVRSTAQRTAPHSARHRRVVPLGMSSRPVEQVDPRPAARPALGPEAAGAGLLARGHRGTQLAAARAPGVIDGRDGRPASTVAEAGASDRASAAGVATKLLGRGTMSPVGYSRCRR